MDEEEVDHFATDDEAPTEPLRILATAGGGIQIRLINDLTFSQDRFAPSFVDLYGAVVIPGSGMLRHGFGLTFGINLTGDGPVGATGVAWPGVVVPTQKYIGSLNGPGPAAFDPRTTQA